MKKTPIKVNQALLGDICGVIASALKDSISNVIFWTPQPFHTKHPDFLVARKKEEQSRPSFKFYANNVCTCLYMFVSRLCFFMFFHLAHVG